MYLYFNAPIDGYLTVYLLDETTLDVYCLLPYKTAGEGAYKVKHDTPYVFFSQEHETANSAVVEEYTITCNHETEFNDMYIIFSTEIFAKVNADNVKNDVLPMHLHYKDFQKWLTHQRSKNKYNSIQIKQITIKR